jgi:hypothetical protein
VHNNLAQAANWGSLVQTSLELQLCPLFQMIELTKIPYVYLWSSLLIEKGDTIAAPKTFLSDCANFQPAPNCAHLSYFK